MDLTLLVASLLTALPAAVVDSSVEHEFVFRANGPANRVNLAGTFNGWNRDATPMVADPGTDNRVWRIRVRLQPGKHLYKFVINGETWVTDPNAARNEDDGNGNINSVLIILPPGFDLPARVGDGRITDGAIVHDQEIPARNWDRGRLFLSLRVRPNDVEKVEVVIGGRTPIPMVSIDRDDLHETLRAELPWDRRTDLNYAFRLTDGPLVRYFGPNGLTGGLGSGESANRFSLSAREFRPFTPPEWVERSVFYQIFPDRFENGDKSNDPPGVVPWDGTPTYWNFKGGDLAGIDQRIGHLTSLGIDAIYFNPIFESPANHRYETTDFRRIDRRLGTNEQFGELTRRWRRMGIRVVLDGVFNHTATNFPQFDDIVRNGETSPYRNWFFIRSFPVRVGDPPNYEAWFGFPSMPKVNLEYPPARDYMLDVVNFWNERAEVAGWRLDVANEVPMSFWRLFRERVKGLDPDMWIVGEVWGDGSPWLKGDQWDSVMNYQFREAVLQYVANGSITPTQFMDRLMRVHHGYGPQVSRNMMNLLGSHDTPRFRTLAGGREDLSMLGATLLMTWVGSPSIYYGDEIGMEGGRDPDNRRGMEWHRATPDNRILDHYRRLIAIRRQSRALQSGDPLVLHTDDARRVAAFARIEGSDLAIVVASRSETPVTVDLPLPRSLVARHGSVLPRLQDSLGGIPIRRLPNGNLRLSLPPLGSAVLTPGPASRVLSSSIPPAAESRSGRSSSQIFSSTR
ncbi:MAG: alpha-amylase family glycosyl hydrolase [Fimbriimonadaceae bacterium]